MNIKVLNIGLREIHGVCIGVNMDFLELKLKKHVIGQLLNGIYSTSTSSSSETDEALKLLLRQNDSDEKA